MAPLASVAAATVTVEPGALAPSDLDALLTPVHGFPGVDLVAAAAAYFPRNVVHSGLLDGGREGRDFLLQISPGTVGVRMVDGERTARTAARDRGAGRQAVAGANLSDLITGAQEFPHLVGQGFADDMAELGRMVRVGDLGYDDDLGYDLPANLDGGGARAIAEWSRKSRRSMTRALAELDYAPMFADDRQPAMLTLTYPGDWLVVAPNGAAAKGHLRALVRRWSRAWHVCGAGCVVLARKGSVWPAALTKGRGVSTRVRWVTRHAYVLPPYLWKMEFQRRGAPHFHLFAVPEHGRVRCTCCGASVNFTRWLSHAWAAVVAHPDPFHRAQHLLAGTGVDWAEGSRATDPKRLAVYFTKHGGAAGGKEYQHRVPAAWAADDLGYPAVLGYGAPVNGPGRFWGYSGLERVRAEVLLAADAYILARRTLRRLAAAKGLTRSRRVPRGWDRRTGARAYRSVTRRAGYLTHGGLAGGWLCVNDGPAVALSLARWLAPEPDGHFRRVLP